MNEALWKQVEDFDIEDNYQEYGFATRLSDEQCWTRQFTKGAILEYKKFMYLAATSTEMVSPSEIVDMVWHQHLLFSKSYSAFCEILGKQIEHVPSTHNRNEYARFAAAKEHTTRLYIETFGQQPKQFWEYRTMLESLELATSRLTMKNINVLAAVFILLLVIPFYLLLKPLYVHIDNPDFVIGYLLLITITAIVLEMYNRKAFANMVARMPADSFVYLLHPFELIYLKTGKLQHVIHGVMNDILDLNKAVAYGDRSIELNDSSYNSPEQFQAISLMQETGRTYYHRIVHELVAKPMFAVIRKSMDAFLAHFRRSEHFISIYAINIMVASLIFLVVFTRVITGTLRDKPTGIIIFVMFATVIAAILMMARVRRMIATITLPKLYKDQLVPSRGGYNSWEWQYFMMGNAALIPAFFSIIQQADRRSDTGGAGGSCGSSCGSCGGGGGGCGGCGGGD